MPDVQTPSIGLPEASRSLVACAVLSSAQPVNTDGDLDVGIALEHLHEALMAIRVGGNPVDAAHLHDRALAAQFVEQPLCAELGVFDLVVRQNVGLRRRDRLVDRDHHDPLVRRLLDDWVQRFAIGGVDDDDVRASRNEVADVSDLFRRTAIAVGDDNLRDLA